MFKLSLLLASALCLSLAKIYELDLIDPSQYSAIKGKSINVQMGDVIIIQVSENPSTGYTWELNTPEERNEESPVFLVKKNEYVED